MHSYTLRFTAKSLDESRLRDVLEKEFRLSSVAIIRDSQGDYRPPVSLEQPKNEIDAALIKCLSDGKPWRRKTLFEHASSVVSNKHAIHSALIRLEQRGAIRKLRHGVFISPDAPLEAGAQIPPMNMDVERPTYDKAVSMLTTPRSATELRKELQVSRQRIDQMLKKMMREGEVRRFEVSGESDSFVYILTSHFNKDDLLTRDRTLRSPRDRLLSSLPPETLCRAAELSLIALTSSIKLGLYLEQLSALGLIITFKLGSHNYVGVTPRGLSHPQYDRAAPKCSAANVAEDFGGARTQFVQNLGVLGCARTIDLTYAVPKNYFDDKGRASGQVIQSLERAGIVTKMESEEGRHPLYSLTDQGRFVSGILGRHHPPRSGEDLRRAIAERHREKSERMHTLGLRKNGAHPIGSPTQAAILRALEAGPLTTGQIALKMDTKFKNPRSVHLALRTLQERGVIARAGIATKNENIWDLTENKPDRAHHP